MLSRLSATAIMAGLNVEVGRNLGGVLYVLGEKA